MSPWSALSIPFLGSCLPSLGHMWGEESHRLGAQSPGALLAEPPTCHPKSSWGLRGSRAQVLLRALTNSHHPVL